MARLTFKEYLNEEDLLTRPLRMVKFKKDPTTGKPVKDTEAEKEDIANHPDNGDQLNTLVSKPEATLDPNQREVPKPIASGGIGKEIALARANPRNRATNKHFGPSQFYQIGAELKGPSVTTRVT